MISLVELLTKVTIVELMLSCSNLRINLAKMGKIVETLERYIILLGCGDYVIVLWGFELGEGGGYNENYEYSNHLIITHVA